jgi:CNT family concentrative nucleoside transporter
MENVIGLLGIAAIMGVAVLMSNNRKAINWRTPLVGFSLQATVCALVLFVPLTKDLFLMLASGLDHLLSATVQGGVFILNKQMVEDQFMFAIRIGLAIVFVSSLSALLYYLRVTQFVVKQAARFLTKALGITGPEAVSTAAAVFVGQVECQVLIKPYLSKLTPSQLFCSLTAAMATIAGAALLAYISIGMNPTFLIAASIQSAINGIVVAKIMFPETDARVLAGEVELAQAHEYHGVLDAMTQGALQDGWKIARNVVIMVAMAVTYIALLNTILGTAFHPFGISLTIQDILGYLFAPVAMVIGIPWHEAFNSGRLMGTEISLNEFAAYSELAKVIAGTAPYTMSPRSQMITTMALCGFCNLGSMAINIGGLGAMAPERRKEISGMVFKALVAANFATWISAATAGLLFSLASHLGM